MSQVTLTQHNTHTELQQTIQRKYRLTLPVISNKPVPLHILASRKTYAHPITNSLQPELWALAPLIKHQSPKH